MSLEVSQTLQRLRSASPLPAHPRRPSRNRQGESLRRPHFPCDVGLCNAAISSRNACGYSTFTEGRLLLLNVLLGVLVELLLAAIRAEVVGPPLVLAPPSGILRIHIHPANRVFRHLEPLPFTSGRRRLRSAALMPDVPLRREPPVRTTRPLTPSSGPEIPSTAAYSRTSTSDLMCTPRSLSQVIVTSLVVLRHLVIRRLSSARYLEREHTQRRRRVC